MFQPGDPLSKLSARWLNSVDSLVRRDTGQQPAANAPPLGGSWDSSIYIKVRNNSGEPVPRWGVLRLTTAVIKPWENLSAWQSEVVMNGDLPNGFDPLFCITLEPLADGAIGRAVIAGAAHANIYIPDFTVPPYKFATPVVGRTDVLVLNQTQGCPILYLAPREGDMAKATVILDPGQTVESHRVSGVSSAAYLGCDLADCLGNGSRWLDPIPCGPCEQSPNAYGLLFFTGGSPRSARCCGLKLWEEPLFSDEYNGRDIIVHRVGSTCRYESHPIECANLGNVANCGRAKYVWNAGYTSRTCTYRWEWRDVECSGFHFWQAGYVDALHPELGFQWYYAGNSCDCPDDEVSPPVPPSAGPSSASDPQVNMPCGPSTPQAWFLRTDLLAGCPEGWDWIPGASAPTDPPGGGPTVVEYSGTWEEEDPESSGWQVAIACQCGTAPPPGSPGSVHGEEVWVNCDEGGGDGYDGYPQYVKWVLEVDGADSTLRLETATGTVIFGYKLDKNRDTWCCQCSNPMILSSCGPYPCEPPALACVRANIHRSCTAVGLGEFVEVSISDAGNSTQPWPLPCYDDDIQAYADEHPELENIECWKSANWTPVGHQADRLAGTFLLQNEGDVWVGGPEGWSACQWVYEETSGTPGGDCPGDETTLRIQLRIRHDTLSAELHVSLRKTNFSPPVTVPYGSETNAVWEGTVSPTSRTLSRICPSPDPDTIPEPPTWICVKYADYCVGDDKNGENSVPLQDDDITVRPEGLPLTIELVPVE